jgi:ATP-dependent DNA ligase
MTKQGEENGTLAPTQIARAKKHTQSRMTGDGAAIFRHACWTDLDEGIVSKRIGSRYVSGRTRAFG